MKELWKEFKKGLFLQNPVLILMVGLCSVLAVSTTVKNAIGMTLGFSFVLITSELIVSAIRKIIPNHLRIPIFLVVIAGSTTVVDLVMKAYSPTLSKSLGIFIPLIVVNCIVLARVEAFAYKKSILVALFDALGMSVGYGIAIVSLAVVREILGSGTFLGYRVFPQGFKPAGILLLPPGAFIILGIYIAIIRGYIGRKS